MYQAFKIFLQNVWFIVKQIQFLCELKMEKRYFLGRERKKREMFIVERKKEESGEIGERGGGILILGRESDK